MASASAAGEAQAALQAAAAARSKGDNPAAIVAFRAAIDAATEANDRRLLAIANGNLANTLRDTGRIDDALPLYEEALGWEDDPHGRAIIRSSQADALAMLGELRQALQTHQQRVAELESSGGSPRELAIALSRVAGNETQLGATDAALTLLDHARALIPGNDSEALAVNALQRAGAWREREAWSEAAAAFEEAWAHVQAHADASIAAAGDARYVQAFRRACLTRIPVERARPMLLNALIAKDRGDWIAAQQHLATARAAAAQQGDIALCMRIDLNGIAMLSDAGQLEQAAGLLDKLRHEAEKNALALPEAMANGALGVISARTGMSFGNLGSLGLYARAQALAAMHEHILRASALTPAEQTWDLMALRTGILDNQLALAAQGYHAHAFAAASFQRAAAVLPPDPPSFELANRLCGWLSALDALEQTDDADRLAQLLDRLLQAPGLNHRTLLVVNRTLGSHRTTSDPDRATTHFRQACDAAQALRATLPPGPKRSEANRDYSHLHRTLAHLLQGHGRDADAFDAVQHEKARRLTDMLALRRGLSDAPLRLAQVQALLHPDELLVDLVGDADDITAYLVGRDSLRSLRVPGATRALARAQFGDIEEREQALLTLCRTDPLLTALVERVSAAAGEGTRLIVVPDDALHNLPLHMIPLRGRPWSEAHPLSFLPAAGVLGLIDAPLDSRACFVAGDSALNLPEASEECRAIAALLGTRAHVGAECTRAAAETALRGQALDIVHLAVHGRGDPQRGGRASLLLGDDDVGGVAWVAFDELAAWQWRANLVVLSGCSTGVAGPRAGHELHSVARAALEAGAASVLACLWPVGDAVARSFMTAFHTALAQARAEGAVDLRLMVAKAQSAVELAAGDAAFDLGARRDGRPLATVPDAIASSAEPTTAWAPFVLLGRTTLPARAAA